MVRRRTAPLYEIDNHWIGRDKGSPWLHHFWYEGRVRRRSLRTADLHEAIWQLHSFLKRNKKTRRIVSPRGLIYFVRIGGSGPIKIGWTGGGVETRVEGLQTGAPEPIQILATVEGKVMHERMLHRHFHASRKLGEWFEPTDQLLAFISKVAETGGLPLLWLATQAAA